MLPFFESFFNFVIGVLPKSPFSSFISAIANIPYLAELNWFLPVSEMIAVMEAWLAAIVVYYLYIAIVRFIGVIA